MIVGTLIWSARALESCNRVRSELARRIAPSVGFLYVHFESRHIRLWKSSLTASN